MERPVVSVVMATYNASEYIAASIESVLSQTYAKLELLITDDNSSDPKVREILESYRQQDSRVRVFYQQENFGPGVARNNCIHHAVGRYIAFCDSDDCWLPEKLERQLCYMQKRNIELCFSSYRVCDEEGREHGVVIGKEEETFRSMLLDDGMGFLTTIYDTARIGKIYMPDMRKRQDWAYKLLLLQRIDVAYGLKEPLAIYRVRRNSVSRNKFSLVKYNINVYRKVLGYSMLKACFIFSFGFIPKHLAKVVRVKLQNL